MEASRSSVWLTLVLILDVARGAHERASRVVPGTYVWQPVDCQACLLVARARNFHRERRAADPAAVQGSRVPLHRQPAAARP